MNNSIPNKKIRTIILLSILLIYLGTTVYVAITKENNKLVGQFRDYNQNEYYDDYDDYDDYYDEDDYDDYDDYEDDYYYENKDGELSLTSSTVTALYDYVKYYPYVTNIKESFKTSELTSEEKLRLVMASLKSQNELMSQPVSEVTEKEVIINDKTYYITTPVKRYERYQVTSKYGEIFGSSYDFDYSAIMYDGDDVLYKYNQAANGYVKYVAANAIETTPINPQKVKAIRTGNKIELQLKAGNKTEKYIFKQEEGYQYLYTFIERVKVEEQKNSL